MALIRHGPFALLFMVPLWLKANVQNLAAQR
jgi:hypothetical protein